MSLALKLDSGNQSFRREGKFELFSKYTAVRLRIQETFYKMLKFIFEYTDWQWYFLFEEIQSSIF